MDSRGRAKIFYGRKCWGKGVGFCKGCFGGVEMGWAGIGKSCVYYSLLVR